MADILSFQNSPSPELAEASTEALGDAIGKVEISNGDAFIVRADGTRIEASEGTPVFEGDVVETESDGSIGLVFADNSTFSLAESGRMVIDEMIYEPGSEDGSSQISVLEGVFTFVSGEVAKTGVDAMAIQTPTATIGIRGTSGGGKIPGADAAENEIETFTLFADPDGTVGEMSISTAGGSQTLNVVNQTTQISDASVPPSSPVVMPAGAVQRFYSKASTALPPHPVSQPNGADDQGDTSVETPNGVESEVDGETELEADVELAAAATGVEANGLMADAMSTTAEADPTDGTAAAEQAFDEALASGASLDEAFALAGHVAAANANGVRAGLNLPFAVPDNDLDSLTDTPLEGLAAGPGNLVSQANNGKANGKGANNGKSPFADEYDVNVDPNFVFDYDYDSGANDPVPESGVAEANADAAQNSNNGNGVGNGVNNENGNGGGNGANNENGNGGGNGGNNGNGGGNGAGDEIANSNDNDVLTGSAADDVLSGGAGDDNLTGKAGNDVLSGDSGNDILNGSVGDDSLIGGAGNDDLTGGKGGDRFFFSGETAPAMGLDTIQDFSGQSAFGPGSSDGDQIVLDTSDLGISSIAYEEIAWDGTDLGLTLTNTSANVIVLTGTAGTAANAAAAIAAGNAASSDAIFLFHNSSSSDVLTMAHTDDADTGGNVCALAEFANATDTSVAANLCDADFGVVA